MNKNKKAETTEETLENQEINEQETTETSTEQTEENTETQEEENPIEKLEAENKALNDKYLRLLAEFENYKRRTAKERMELFKTAGKEIILDLLPVMDDFERGFESMENAKDVKSVKKGVELVYNKFKTTLNSKGLKAIETEGKEFDTELHEAISQVPAPKKKQKNKVLAQVEKGYKLNEQVIRFAKVVVGV